MSTYLEVAQKVLETTGIPMNSKEILRAAYSMNLLPSELYGKTQHKTFHARISVDIRKKGEKSVFYRVARGVFFLNKLRNSPHLSKQQQRGIKATTQKEVLAAAGGSKDGAQAILGILDDNEVYDHWDNSFLQEEIQKLQDMAEFIGRVGQALAHAQLKIESIDRQLKFKASCEKFFKQEA